MVAPLKSKSKTKAGIALLFAFSAIVALGIHRRGDHATTQADAPLKTIPRKLEQVVALDIDSSDKLKPAAPPKESLLRSIAAKEEDLDAAHSARRTSEDTRPFSSRKYDYMDEPPENCKPLASSRASVFGRRGLRSLHSSLSLSFSMIGTHYLSAHGKSGKAGWILLFAFSAIESPASAFDISIHEDTTQQLQNEVYENLKFKQVALDQVRSANAKTDYFGFSNPVNHCDDEMLFECSQKIVNDLNRAETFLKQSPPNGNEARKAFGTAIHTGQDFYAHSNWANVNTGGGTIETRLGVSTLTNPPLARAFCANNDGGALLPNPGGDITTGYFYFSCFANPPQGKCIHGYKGRLSPPFCAARNGINKDNGSIVALSQATEVSLFIREDVMLYC